MEDFPARTLSQNALTSGASGSTQPRPMMAMGSLETDSFGMEIRNGVGWRGEGAEKADYRGTRPCFFCGRLSRLLMRGHSAAIRRGRVSEGSMTSSTQPRSAATYGLANFSW